MQIEDVLDLIHTEKPGWVELRATDLRGRLRSLHLPAEEVQARTFTHGVEVDGAAYGLPPGRELVLLPDPNTARLDRTFEPPVLVLLCDIGYPDGDLHPWAPRTVARAAEEFLSRAGPADAAMFSVTIEFYLLRDIELESSPTAQVARLEPLEGVPGTGTFVKETVPVPESSYHRGSPLDRGVDIRREVSELLREWGIPVRFHYHGPGSAGQMVLELSTGSLLEAADWTVIAMDLISRFAVENGLFACFLPAPFHGFPGCGLHLRQCLVKGEGNLFAPEEGTPVGGAPLSEIGLQYAGGLLLHGRSLAALVAPSTSSYRRFSREGSPSRLFLGVSSPEAVVEVPGYLADPSSAAVTLRASDPSCNPYFALAASLMAGLDGIRQGIDPISRGWGPCRGNFHGLPARARRRIKPLPRDLLDALEALERDHDYLALGGVFPKDLIRHWAELKRREALEVLARPHPYEFFLYGEYQNP